MDKESTLKSQLNKKEKLIEELQKEIQELRKETREEIVKLRKENEVNQMVQLLLAIATYFNNVD